MQNHQPVQTKTWCVSSQQIEHTVSQEGGLWWKHWCVSCDCVAVAKFTWPTEWPLFRILVRSGSALPISMILLSVTFEMVWFKEPPGKPQLQTVWKNAGRGLESHRWIKPLKLVERKTNTWYSLGRLTFSSLCVKIMRRKLFEMYYTGIKK